jgi:hypothetical protein
VKETPKKVGEPASSLETSEEVVTNVRLGEAFFEVPSEVR